MPEKDYNKQIARRESIKRTTLVVGMDIGCEFNAMCLMNKDGEVLGRYPKIYNSRQGFNYFYKTIEEMSKEGFQRSDYWLGAYRTLLAEDRLFCQR